MVVGGAFAALKLRRDRLTQDVDIMGLENTNAERLALMELAEQEGYPIETMNSAVDYFVRKIPDWESHLVELYRGQKSVVYGPDLTLFVMLKVGRMSEQDLADCLDAVDRSKRTNEKIDWARVQAAIELSGPLSDAAMARQAQLISQRL